MTLLEAHKKKWQGCTRCLLCKNKGRKNVVIYRGVVPCDVLFIGEAPGTSENAEGLPFWGPAGKLLDDIIQRAYQSLYADYEDWNKSLTIRTAFTNLVGCIPLGEGGIKATEPPLEAIQACSERVREFFVMAKPKLVVCVGELAVVHTGYIQCQVDYIHIVHPAAILRAELVRQAIPIKKCVVTIADAVRELGLHKRGL
jgi:uracil-DNA glycosylase family 4